MKNETNDIRQAEKKAGLTAGRLPWWARVLIAQHAKAAFRTTESYGVHHCSDCGCVLISMSIVYQYFSCLCPECSKKIQSTQGGY